MLINFVHVRGTVVGCLSWVRMSWDVVVVNGLKGLTLKIALVLNVLIESACCEISNSNFIFVISYLFLNSKPMLSEF